MQERVGTKGQILREAERLFQNRGFNGFSYKDIAQKLGVKNAAIHYHYATKSALGNALLDRYLRLLERSREIFRADGDARFQLEGYIEFIRMRFEQDGRICPIGILAADYHTVPEEMREKARRLVAETLDWLTEVLFVGREKGVFRYAGRPEEKAVAVKACLQGAAQLARIMGPQVLEAAVAQVRREVGLQ